MKYQFLLPQSCQKEFWKRLKIHGSNIFSLLIINICMILDSAWKIKLLTLDSYIRPQSLESLYQLDTRALAWTDLVLNLDCVLRGLTILCACRFRLSACQRENSTLLLVTCRKLSSSLLQDHLSSRLGAVTSLLFPESWWKLFCGRRDLLESQEK